MPTMIRFVGGPWHNRIVTVRELLMAIQVPSQTQSASIFNLSAGLSRDSFRHETYELFRFYTEYGTLFSQYVHESCIRKSEPIKETYSDRAPPELPQTYFHEFLARVLMRNAISP